MSRASRHHRSPRGLAAGTPSATNRPPCRPISRWRSHKLASRFRAVCFDLLTALLDSWSLWGAVAGDAEAGRRWREAATRLITGSGSYRPYELVVVAAAREVGLPEAAAQELLRRWEELQPYPDSAPALAELQAAQIPLVVVTNTSQALANAAAAKLPNRWTSVLSAEQIGWYKPAPQAYAAGVRAAGAPPAELLFVAGSEHDVVGAEAAGLPTYWANRRGQPLPAGLHPLAVAPTVEALPGFVLGR